MKRETTRIVLAHLTLVAPLPQPPASTLWVPYTHCAAVHFMPGLVYVHTAHVLCMHHTYLYFSFHLSSCSSLSASSSWSVLPRFSCAFLSSSSSVRQKPFFTESVSFLHLAPYGHLTQSGNVNSSEVVLTAEYPGRHSQRSFEKFSRVS